VEFWQRKMEIMVNKEFWKGKKVLITGHTGFKGSWLCMYLNTLGAEVFGYSLKPPTEVNLYELCKINSFVKSTISDVRDFNSLLKKIEDDRPEIIIHMAAQPLVRLSYNEPVLTYQTNIIGTINLLEAMRVSNSRSVKVLVNVTTDKCYENKEWLWPYRENDPLGGYDPYSSSKACSEIVTASYRNSYFNPTNYEKHGVAIATARAGNVIGGGDWAIDRLIPDILRSILENKLVIIRSPGSIRPWQHVLEPLTGYLMLAERLYSEGGAFAESWNFGPNDDDIKPVKWIVDKLCDLWGNGSGYVLDKNILHHEATYLKLDCSKAKEKLKWYPQWDLGIAIDSIIEFTRAYVNKDDLKALCDRQISEYQNSQKIVIRNASI
jgi:CDP-glucose 4,6-dehydratase